ncbi:hypothetical protein [Cytobacillus kochii]
MKKRIIRCESDFYYHFTLGLFQIENNIISSKHRFFLKISSAKARTATNKRRKEKISSAKVRTATKKRRKEKISSAKVRTATKKRRKEKISSAKARIATKKRRKEKISSAKARITTNNRKEVYGEMTTARVYENQLAHIRYKCDKFVQFHSIAKTVDDKMVRCIENRSKVSHLIRKSLPTNK